MSDVNQDNVSVDFKDTESILRHVLKTITERCKEEADSNACDIPSTDYQARISHYTGLSNDLINCLLSGKKVFMVSVSTLDIASRISILEAIKTQYLQHKLPTYKTIFEKAPKTLRTGNDKLISDVNAFVKELNALGYISKETKSNCTIVMEDPEVRFERFMYLLKLKKIRNNNTQWQNIVYVDERIINDEYNFKRPWLSNASLNQFGLEACVYYHAVASSGFITGLFTNQASKDDFAKWLSDILLAQLKVPSVIIMDRNPLHGTLEHASSISRYHSKSEMLRWLTDNNIPCNSNMSKPALYELISKCTDNRKEYKIDRIIRSHGHEVLRLPRHFYDLSITTLFWDNFLKSIGTMALNTPNDIQFNITKAITSVLPTTWADYEQSIVKIESQLYDIDMTIENLCDKYEIKM